MNSSGTAVLIGTLDTKAREYAYVRERLSAMGLKTILIDAGVFSSSSVGADISAADVAAAAGATLSDLQFDHEGSETRAVALETMTRGATALVLDLLRQGLCDGVFGMGGSGGSALVSGVLRSLPFGVPKLLVSTMASGDVSAYVGSSDLCIMHSVTDIAGLNRISRPVLANAAGALAGMIAASQSAREDVPRKTTVGITMLGVTTAGVLRVVDRLERAGYEPIVFHAVGSGGKALEALIQDGAIDAVIDYTVKEITDELLGGIFTAGPQRLRSAGRKAIPQIVVPGAVEVINFGGIESVPERLRDGSRPLVQHNAQVTAVRATAEELERVAEVLAARLNESRGAVSVLIPTTGFDSYATGDGPFADHESDARFIAALKSRLSPRIDVTAIASDINDPTFADAVADRAIAQFRAPARADESAVTFQEGQPRGKRQEEESKRA